MFYFFFAAILMYSLFFIPIFVLFLNLESLLLLLGQHRETSRYAAQYFTGYM